MKKLIALFIIIICHAQILALSITNIHISGKGQKPEEAKQNALESALLRATIIMSDKMGGLSKKLQDSVTYNSAAKVVSKYELLSEEFKDREYNARLNVFFDRHKLNQLIYNNSPVAIKIQFNEALILPVFKLGTQHFFSPNSYEWIKIWHDNSKLIEDNKLILMNLNNNNAPEFLQKLDLETITYQDFDQIMGAKLIKKVIIAIAEFDTDFNTRQSFLNVTFVNLIGSDKKIINKKYLIPTDTKMTIMLQKIFNEFLESHQSQLPQNMVDVENDQWTDATRTESLTLYLELYNQRDWVDINSKLKQIKNIEKINLMEQNGNELQIEIQHNLNSKDFMKLLYEHGLTYMNKNRKNYIIEIKK